MLAVVQTEMTMLLPWSDRLAVVQAEMTMVLCFLSDRLAGVQVGVAMILSFFVLWDLPNIRKGITSLRTSRLAPVYEEVAPSLTVFGTLFGKALQAQVGLILEKEHLDPAYYALLTPSLCILNATVFMFLQGFRLSECRP